MPQKRQKREQVVKITKCKRTSYSIKQKTEVVTYVRLNERNKAAIHYKLNPSIVGRWLKASNNWSIETANK